jgi:hypothetical protein
MVYMGNEKCEPLLLHEFFKSMKNEVEIRKNLIIVIKHTKLNSIFFITTQCNIITVTTTTNNNERKFFISLISCCHSESTN